MSTPAGTESSATPKRAPSALTHLPSHLRLWITMAAALGLDLWSKHWIFSQFDPREVRPFVSGVVNFQRSMNAGAVFGSFTGQVGLFILASVLALAFVLYLFAGSARRQWSLHLALGLILAGALGNLYDRAYVKADVLEFNVPNAPGHTFIGKIVERDEKTGDVLIGFWPDGREPQRFSAAEVTGEKRQGVVRDFIKFVPQFPEWTPVLGGREVWPWVFNIADASLVCGVCGLILCPWMWRKPAETSAD